MTKVHYSEFYSRLRISLNRPLPGIEAQKELAIVSRRTFARTPQNAKQAAVCAVLYPHSDHIVRIAFIQRAHHDQDRHSGQISFPGGQVEQQDANLMQTALRELHEEIGIEVGDDQILGALSSLYIPVSNFLVHPYVIALNEKPEVLLQESEVAEIFGFDLHKLMQTPILRKEISGHGYTIPDAPYFNIEGRTLWGATAMMTNELLTVVRSMG